MENRYKVTLDFKQRSTFNINFVQNNIDTDVIEFSVVDGGQAVDITGQVISIAFLKQDKTLVIQDISSGVSILEGGATGKLQVILKSNTLASVGIVKGEISFSLAGKKLSTATFMFTVLESLDNGEGILSIDEIPLLDAKIIEATNKISEINAEEVTWIASEATRVSNENTRVSSEVTRVSSENTRVSSEVTRVSNEGTRVTDFAAMLNSSKMILKNPVASFVAIATTYPAPVIYWTVRTIDDGKIYRYDGATWVWIDTLNITVYDTLLTDFTSYKADYATDIKTLGAKGDGVLDNSVAFTAMNAQTEYRIPSGVYNVTQNTTIIRTSSIQFAPGAVIKPALGVTVTIDAHIADTMHQIFDVSNGGIISGLRKNDYIRPEWFGAKGDYNLTLDTGTSDSIAFQSAIDTIEREHLPCLLISSSRYLFGTTVIIRTGGWTLKGPNGVSRPSLASLTNGFITGVTGLDCLFDYGNNSSFTITNHFEIDGVSFYGQLRMDKAIRYSESGDGPHRGFNVIRSVFGGFKYGIYFNTTVIGVTIICADVCIEGSYFYGIDANSFAVYAVTPIWGFRFVNNQSEQKARIGGKINGPITITDNMLEGQRDTVFIDGGLIHALIERNYFEANSGDYIIKVASTNNMSSIIIRNNYGINFVTKTNIITQSSGKLEISDSFMERNKFTTTRIPLGSTVRNNEFYIDPTLLMNTAMVAELNESHKYTESYITGATVTNIIAPGTNIPVETPMGTKNVSEKSTNSGYYILNEASLINDYVVFNVFIKYKLAKQIFTSPLLQVFNSDYTAELTGGLTAPCHTNYGKFVLLTYALKLTAPATALKFLLTANNTLIGADVDLVQYGSAKVYHLTQPTNFYVTPSIK